MQILDLTCCKCHMNFNVDDFGTTFIIHMLDVNNGAIDEIESDEIKCPCCGSKDYTERHFYGYWEE